MTMGRHQADTFLSFYVQSPSSFVFEVAWNSMRVDDVKMVQDRPLHSFVWGLDMVGPVVMDYLKIENQGASVPPHVRAMAAEPKVQLATARKATGT